MISKIELINRLQSPENRSVLQAVDELRSCGKLLDGSLRGIALCQAQLDSADLKDTDLCYVDLHQANMDYVDLTNAKLRATKLNRASLQGANLAGTDLTSADLYKVNFRGSLNLTDGQLSAANELFGAIMPDGSVYDGRFNLPGDLARAKWAKVKVEDPKSMADFYGVSLDTYLQGQKKNEPVVS